MAETQNDLLAHAVPAKPDNWQVNELYLQGAGGRNENENEKGAAYP
jgi:hypothetical protein